MAPITECNILMGELPPIPVHKNDNLPKGLLSKIVRADLEMDWEDFGKMIE
jgi:predicted sugar kinase